MQRKFHQDVDELKTRVLEMGRLSRQSVSEGVDAFVAMDVEKAKEVVAFNQKINRKDVEIEARTLDLIAHHQPMAVDLRTLGASLKIITYLDRIGRYGYDIAQATIALEGKSHGRKLASIPHMRDRALRLLDNALEAYRDGKADLARTVQPDDDEVDALYEQIFRESLTYMIEDPRTISQCTQYILVARHLERVGDNAGKIAEKTIYMVTGERRLEPRETA